MRIAFVADPSATWSLVREEGYKSMINSHLIQTLTLKPWHDSALWHWLGDCGIGSNAMAERAYVSKLTGNWPFLLYRFHERLSAEKDRWKQALESTIGPSQIPDLLPAFGLNIPEVAMVMKTFAQFGEPATVNDLSVLCDNLSSQLVQAVIDWADRLSLLTPAEDLKWRIDPIVAGLFRLEGG